MWGAGRLTLQGATARSDWYNNSWAYRCAITHDKTKMAAAETGFVLAFDLGLLGSGHGFWTHAKSDGGDIIVTAADGITRKSVHVIEIDTTGKKGAIRFNDDAPTAADTKWYLYYGNAWASQPAVSAAYGANAAYGGSACLFALPMAGDDTQSQIDFSASPLSAAANSSLAETIEVKIGKSSRKFTSTSSRYMEWTTADGSKLDLSGASAAFTVCGLTKLRGYPAADGSKYCLYNKNNSQWASAVSQPWAGQYACKYTVYDGAWREAEASATLLYDGNWHSFISRTYSGGHRNYADTVSDSAASHGTICSVDTNFQIGTSAGSNYLHAYMQMFEIYNTDKGASFVTSWYNMMIGNSTFWKTIGAEESY